MKQNFCNNVAKILFLYFVGNMNQREKKFGKLIKGRPSLKSFVLLKETRKGN